LSFAAPAGCEPAANQLRIRAPRAALAPVHSFVIEAPEIGRGNDAKREAAPAIHGWPRCKINVLTLDCGDWGKSRITYSKPGKSGI
jgi:hypothetical protein